MGGTVGRGLDHHGVDLLLRPSGLEEEGDRPHPPFGEPAVKATLGIGVQDDRTAVRRVAERDAGADRLAAAGHRALDGEVLDLDVHHLVAGGGVDVPGEPAFVVRPADEEPVTAGHRLAGEPGSESVGLAVEEGQARVSRDESQLPRIAVLRGGRVYAHGEQSRLVEHDGLAKIRLATGQQQHRTELHRGESAATKVDDVVAGGEVANLEETVVVRVSRAAELVEMKRVWRRVKAGGRDPDLDVVQGQPIDGGGHETEEGRPRDQGRAPRERFRAPAPP